MMQYDKCARVFKKRRFVVYFRLANNLLKMHIDSIVFMIFVVKQLTSTIPYNNVVQVLFIAIVHFILFSKMAELTHDAELTPFYGKCIFTKKSNKLRV